jgi:hypothetical protein
VKETSKKYLHTVSNRSLNDVLQPSSAQRLLASDVQRRQNFPGRISEGAQLSGKFSVLYWANASAGDFSDSIELNLPTAPLTMVWYLGSQDKTGAIVGDGGGLVPGNAFANDTVSNGIVIFSGASANYCVNKDSLTVNITSTNVGWPSFIDAYFYYAVYYDDTLVADLGL